jgi:hypothetical protein
MKLPACGRDFGAWRTDHRMSSTDGREGSVQVSETLSLAAARAFADGDGADM